MKNKNTIIYHFDDLFNNHLRFYRHRNLLLGNGFSIAAFPEFKYQNLYDKSILSSEIKKIFQMFNTCDYEFVIDKLNDYIKLCNHYKNNYYNYKIRQDILTIQTDLFQCLSYIHPQNLNNKSICNALDFLSKFNNIFTTNYDLLLYWLILEYNKNYINNEEKFYDGFCINSNDYDCQWDESYPKTNLFYLHGAIHLFYNNNGIFKIKSNENNTLLTISRNLQNKNINPLIITEGNSYDKYYSIQKSSYLNYCYSQLCNIKDCLVIHGHSLDKKDEHIFYAINNNYKIRTLLISVYGEDTQTVIKNANEIFKDRINSGSLEIYFYYAESTRIWT